MTLLKEQIVRISGIETLSILSISKISGQKMALINRLVSRLSGVQSPDKYSDLDIVRVAEPPGIKSLMNSESEREPPPQAACP